MLGTPARSGLPPPGPAPHVTGWLSIDKPPGAVWVCLYLGRLLIVCFEKCTKGKSHVAPQPKTTPKGKIREKEEATNTSLGDPSTAT